MDKESLGVGAVSVLSCSHTTVARSEYTTSSERTHQQRRTIIYDDCKTCG